MARFKKEVNEDEREMKVERLYGFTWIIDSCLPEDEIYIIDIKKKKK